MEVNIKIAGEAGQSIETVGKVLNKALPKKAGTCFPSKASNRKQEKNIILCK